MSPNTKVVVGTEAKVSALQDMLIDMCCSSMAKQMAQRKQGLPIYQIVNNVNDLIREVRTADAVQPGNSLYQDMLNKLQPQAPAQPTVDPMNHISKSLHAIHKRQDASDELLAKLADKLDL